MTKEYGLVGHPLGHSFSAAFFTDKFNAEGIDAVYHNFDLPSIEEIKTLCQTHQDLCGFNVTIPYKQAIIPYLDVMSEEAQRIGAVNVVRVVRNEHGDVHLEGYNSDIIGFCQSLSPLLSSDHQKALVLGTGGASKAIVHGLRQLGISSILVSRTAKDGVIAYEDLTPEVMQTHLLVVNCSPLGMFPKVDAAPNIPYELLTHKHICYDLVYNPEETLFMKRSAAQGAVVKNGLEMLHRQALAAWEMWQ